MQRGDSMELNYEGLEMQKWNILSDRAENLDEKNEVICLVIMVTLGVMVIKMSKYLNFCIFCWWQQNPVIIWKKYLRASERSNLAFSENVMDCWNLSYH